MSKKLFRKRPIYDLDLNDRRICSQHNLVNCKANLNTRGNCCVRNPDCLPDRKEAIDKISGQCYNCVPNITQCECAKLNNTNNCDTIVWSTTGDCETGQCNGNPGNYDITSLSPDDWFQTDPLLSEVDFNTQITDLTTPITGDYRDITIEGLE